MAAPVLDSHLPTDSNGASSTTQSQTFRVLVLPGDHVGPEIMTEALRVLDVVESSSNGKVKFEYNHQICGGASIDKHGEAITDEVLRIAKEDTDAVLFGSCGGPEW
jgi:3-isopropylmalate dehydrogenase